MNELTETSHDRIVFKGAELWQERGARLHEFLLFGGMLIIAYFTEWTAPERNLAGAHALAVWFGAFIATRHFRVRHLRRRGKRDGFRDIAFSFGVASLVSAHARLAVSSLSPGFAYNTVMTTVLFAVGASLAGLTVAHMIHRPAKDLIDGSVVIDGNGIEYRDIMTSKRRVIPFSRLQRARIDDAAVELTFEPDDRNSEDPAQRQSMLRLTAWRSTPEELLAAIERCWRAAPQN